MQLPLSRTEISQIEDLSDAVNEAGLSAYQRSREAPTGTLVHAAHDGVTLSSGQFGSRIQIRGALSAQDISIAVGLRIPPRNRLLMRDIDSGIVTAFRPGDDHEAFHDADSLYAVITLREESLDQEAARYGFTFPPNTFRHTGIHPRALARPQLARTSAFLTALHRRDDQAVLDSSVFADTVATFLGHFANEPGPVTLPPLRQRERIVEVARAHIDQSLGQHIDVEDLARRAGVSRRTLARAFTETLGESPRSYINRMRLHRIRTDLLAAPSETATIADISNRWGVGELGRMSSRYRAQFGELPSHTRRRRSGDSAVHA